MSLVNPNYRCTQDEACDDHAEVKATEDVESDRSGQSSVGGADESSKTCVESDIFDDRILKVGANKKRTVIYRPPELSKQVKLSDERLHTVSIGEECQDQGRVDDSLDASRRFSSLRKMNLLQLLPDPVPVSPKTDDRQEKVDEEATDDRSRWNNVSRNNAKDLFDSSSHLTTTATLAFEQRQEGDVTCDPLGFDVRTSSSSLCSVVPPQTTKPDMSTVGPVKPDFLTVTGPKKSVVCKSGPRLEMAMLDYADTVDRYATYMIGHEEARLKQELAEGGIVHVNATELFDGPVVAPVKTGYRGASGSLSKLSKIGRRKHQITYLAAIAGDTERRNAEKKIERTQNRRPMDFN